MGKRNEEGLSEAPASEATNPFDPVTENGAWTKWQLDQMPKVQVFVPSRTRSTDPQHRKLATINGVEYWGECGKNTLVPEEVARIAIGAGVAIGQPPEGTFGALKPVGAPPPDIRIRPDSEGDTVVT